MPTFGSTVWIVFPLWPSRTSTRPSPSVTAVLSVRGTLIGAASLLVQGIAVITGVTPTTRDDEIVSAVVGGSLVAFEHDGTLKWQNNNSWDAYSAAVAPAVAVSASSVSPPLPPCPGPQANDALAVATAAVIVNAIARAAPRAATNGNGALDFGMPAVSP